MSELTNEPIEKIADKPKEIAKGGKQIAHFVEQYNKTAMLLQIIKNSTDKQTVIITKSKRKADELTKYLRTQDIKIAAIHGNHRVSEIKAATKAFDSFALNILVTTDMILQSLNLDKVQQIINYNLPAEPDYYTSRLGCLMERGVSVSLVSPDEQNLLESIEFAIKQDISREEVKDFVISSTSNAARASQYAKDKEDRATVKQNKNKRKKKKRSKTSAKVKNLENIDK